jgi:hypothetical protein
VYIAQPSPNQVSPLKLDLQNRLPKLLPLPFRRGEGRGEGSVSSFCQRPTFCSQVHGEDEDKIAIRIHGFRIQVLPSKSAQTATCTSKKGRR